MIIIISIHAAEPHPPSNLNLVPDGLSLVVSWKKPFSFEGEELSYVVSITNIATGSIEEIILNVTTYDFEQPTDSHDCVEYQFAVFSKNDFSKSNTSINGTAYRPTGKA